MKYTEEMIVPGFEFTTGSGEFIVVGNVSQTHCIMQFAKNDNRSKYPKHIIVDEINAGRWTPINSYYEIY
jgi:hypothetical protein